uniref:Uncharacterized protein n=1 Tax=Rhizobium rhizogenes TaxID=359 RepID=A0A7S4ZVG9_RHIRH|nr:hypothetical protein pC5.7d_652 [Rhizobium rhizogenes]
MWNRWADEAISSRSGRAVHRTWQNPMDTFNSYSLRAISVRL